SFVGTSEERRAGGPADSAEGDLAAGGEAISGRLPPTGYGPFSGRGGGYESHLGDEACRVAGGVRPGPGRGGAGEGGRPADAAASAGQHTDPPRAPTAAAEEQHSGPVRGRPAGPVQPNGRRRRVRAGGQRDERCLAARPERPGPGRRGRPAGRRARAVLGP